MRRVCVPLSKSSGLLMQVDVMFLARSLPQRGALKQELIAQLLRHPRPLAVRCIEYLISLRKWPEGEGRVRVRDA